jgi:hypothetical protein
LFRVYFCFKLKPDLKLQIYFFLIPPMTSFHLMKWHQRVESQIISLQPSNQPTNQLFLAWNRKNPKKSNDYSSRCNSVLKLEKITKTVSYIIDFRLDSSIWRIELGLLIKTCFKFVSIGTQFVSQHNCYKLKFNLT